jgi:hypothetical protein
MPVQEWKMLVLVVSLLHLGGTSVSEDGPSLSSDDGLIAYYDFNNCDARDITGNGSDGQLMGSVQCWCGIEDDGLLLDGRDDFVVFPGIVNAYFSTSDFTISFYVKPEQYSVFAQSLVSKRSQCDLDHAFDLQLNLGRKEVTTIFHESKHKGFKELSPEVSALGWVHIAIVRAGATASSYVNGQLHRRSFKCSGVDITNDAMLTFGYTPCIEGGSTRPFKGVLDELRVYDHALTPEEIQALYDKNPVEHAQVDCLT